jgi:hypothetical protein
MDLRWPVLLVVVAVLAFFGCGSGKPSGSKGYDHFVAASKALETGDKETAFAELSASIEVCPTDWAYFQRARLNLDKGQENEAVADCNKGLDLNSKSRELLWLSAELKKPAAQRFKGKLATPPGSKLTKSR